MSCELCVAPFDGHSGITTTLGYLCYDCVRWIHQAARQTVALAERPIAAVISDIDQTP